MPRQIQINADKGYQNENVALLMKLNLNGWTIDRFGHATKVIKGEKFRFKFQKRTIRREVQLVHPATQYSPASKEWLKLNKKTHYYAKDKA